MPLFAVRTLAADITLSPGESCASASCHASMLDNSGAHEGGAEQQLCGGCHATDNPREHEFRDAASGASLCSSCHADLTQKEHKHAPANLGLCTFCHRAHKSQTAGYLKFPPEALCVSCHKDIVPAGVRTVHGPVAEGQCTACHDPHSSDVDDHLVAAVPQLCFGCHNKDQTDHEGRMLPAVEQSFIDKSLTQHPPFARGDCLLCHDPHASDNIRLQRRPYSQAFYTDFSSDKYFCLMCHGDTTFSEPRTLSATKFRNGNLNLHYRHVVREKGRGCRACHHQHASSLEAQIATDTFLGEQNIGIKTFAKTDSGGTCEPSCHRPVEYDRIEPVDNVFIVTPREGIDATPAELKNASSEHDGRTLFLQRCAGCHGADAEGKIGPPIAGATMEQVLAATNRNDLMMDLASLDSVDLHAIVDSLPAGTAVVALPEGASDGTVLFSTNCAGCHGPDANGRIGPAIRGATSAKITEAIEHVPMMVAMKSLSAESIDDIGEFLSGFGEGSTASTGTAAVALLDDKVVFSMNCAGCHGDDADGRIGPSIRGMALNEINEAIGEVPMMAGLRTLGSTEVAAVGRYLASLETEEHPDANGRVDGKAFYATTCSACHGADASGHIGPDIRGQTAEDIEAAISRVPMMVGVQASTEAQLHAVGAYIKSLAVSTPIAATPNVPDGEAIFQQNCAACHGPDASGRLGPDIRLASIDDITAAIERVPMMLAMRILGAKEISAAADYLSVLQDSDSDTDEQ